MKFSRFLLAAMLLAALAPVLMAQSDDGDTPVYVPKKYVSAEGLTHQQEMPEKASEWVGVGKEIGTATKEGLDAVVDDAEKFGSTKVGTFVMVMIAWKIMAHDIIGIVLGVPLLIAGVFLWWQVMKRLFFGYQVVDKKEGRVKTYRRQDPYDFNTGEARVTAGCAAWVSLAAFTVVMLITIF